MEYTCFEVVNHEINCLLRKSLRYYTILLTILYYTILPERLSDFDSIYNYGYYMDYFFCCFVGVLFCWSVVCVLFVLLIFFVVLLECYVGMVVVLLFLCVFCCFCFCVLFGNVDVDVGLVNYFG